MAQKHTRPTRARREAEEIERSYRRVTSGGRYQKREKKGSGKRNTTAIICVSVLAVIAIIVGCIFLYNADQTGTIAAHVTVAGVDVGGMTQAEAIRAVTEATKNTYTQIPMTVTVLRSQIQIDPKVSNASLNVRAAVKAAFRHGKSGEAVDISPYLHLNESAIKKALNELGIAYSSTLSQSTYEVTGTAPEHVLVVTLGVPEYGLDMNTLYSQVLEAYSANVFTMEGDCGMIEPAPLDLQAILDKYYIAPVDATFDKKTYAIIEGVDGYGFDLEKAEKTLAEAAYGSTVQIPFTNIPPQITAEMLKNTLYKDTFATFTATYESEANRDTNLRLACEAINGIIINPGEVFSYNQALGERTAARGYKPGPTFVNGKTTTTIGGGICQVSSCLYNCALMADLDIRTRENHGYAVSYVRLGMDAAVSWGSLDFCFANNTNYPIRIEASASGGTTTVTLVGTDEKDYYVEMEYEVLATYNYETTYQTLSADNSDGYKNGDYIVEPHTGYSIKTYRCKYSKATEQLLSKAEEDASYYSRCDAVVCVISGGTGNSNQGIGNGGVTDADGALP